MNNGWKHYFPNEAPPILESPGCTIEALGVLRSTDPILDMWQIFVKSQRLVASQLIDLIKWPNYP